MAEKSSTTVLRPRAAATKFSRKMAKPKAPRVDHAVLLQNGQQVGRAGDGLVGLDDDSIERVLGRELLLFALVGLGRNISQDREDRTFDGLADGLEGDLDGATEGEGDVGGRDGLIGRNETLGNTAQDLRGDDAGVAAAPIREPCVMAPAMASMSASAGRAESSLVTEASVSDMLVPVSPSGTGKTLSLLISSALSETAAAAIGNRCEWSLQSWVFESPFSDASSDGS